MPDASEALASRLLRERDEARKAGDILARVILSQSRGEEPELDVRLIGYVITGGPASAMPDGDHMVTRYDPATGCTVVISCFGQKQDALEEIVRLTEVVHRVGLPNQHYRYVKRTQGTLVTRERWESNGYEHDEGCPP